MDGVIGEIRLFAGNFAPRNWAFCNGSLIAISQNQALYSVIGTIYGGDGRTNFGLPDLRGRVPLAPGQGPGLSSYQQGQTGGVESQALNVTQMPPHSHPIGTHTHTTGDHTHAAGTHTHAAGTHTHKIPAHQHVIGTHTHPVSNHDHTIPNHQHSIGNHTHPVPNHSHLVQADAATGITSPNLQVLATPEGGETIYKIYAGALESNGPGGTTNTDAGGAPNTNAGGAPNTSSGGAPNTDAGGAPNTANDGGGGDTDDASGQTGTSSGDTGSAIGGNTGNAGAGQAVDKRQPYLAMSQIPPAEPEA